MQPKDSNHEGLDNEDEIYEDEKKQQEWEQKMLRVYDLRASGRTTILIHVVITAFC